MSFIKIIICAVIAYLIGGLNPSYVIGRLRGFDIRRRGSGNAGASNAVITMGKKEGAICALFDIFKAFLCVKAAYALLPDVAYAGVLCGTACALGHIFPVYMGFRGGKGLACLGGMVLAFNERIFLVMLAVEIVLVLIVDYICIVPITASIAFVPVSVFASDCLALIPITAVLAVVILVKHIGNIKRIMSGTEAHFSFLWRREEELERVTGNRDRK